MSSIESATNAVQISNQQQLRVSVRAQSANESHHHHAARHTGDNNGDRVTLTNSLVRTANLALNAQADEQPQPEERVSSTNLEYQRREATVLRLRTQEGDIVKLKLRNVETTSVQAGQQVDGETVVSNLELTTSSRTRLLISVQGDLNDAELAAIQGVAEQASQLAGAFFSGNLADAFQAASEFAIDGSQLAKVSLRLSIRERLNFAQSAVANAPAPTLPAAEVVDEATTPTSQAATVVPKIVSSASTAPTVTRTDIPLAAAPATTNTAAAADETTAPPAVDDSDSAQPSNLLDAFQALADFLGSIASFLENLLGSFNTPPPANDAETPVQNSGDQSAFSFRFKLELFAAVVTTSLEQSAAVSEQVESVQLLGDTLAAVAHEVDPQSVSELA